MKSTALRTLMGSRRAYVDSILTMTQQPRNYGTMQGVNLCDSGAAVCPWRGKRRDSCKASTFR